MRKSEQQSKKTKSSPSVTAWSRFSLRGFREIISKLLKTSIDNLIYHYRITVWRFFSRIRYLMDWARSDLIRRMFIIAIAFLIVWILVRFVGVVSLSTEQLATYFISLGVMTGSIIAIVFTLSIFAQQSAAYLYSSQHFELYAHDWVEKFIYISIVIITLFFFGFGIFLGSNTQLATNIVRLASVYGSIFLIGLIFVFIDWQYKNVRTKVNPINAIAFLEKQAINFLNRVHKDAQRMAKIIRIKNKDVSEGVVLASIYNNYLTPHLANLDRQIENLFEISMKLSDKHEIKTTNRGIAAVHNILSHYLDIRKDSSLAILSDIILFALESDRGSFLSKSFERLNNAGERFIITRKIENAKYIIDVYKSLALRSKEISFLNLPRENPIFYLIKGYLSFYIDFAIREKDQEIVFQGARALRDLTIVAVEKHLHTSLLGIQEDLLKIATFGITNKAIFIVDECIRGWLGILQAVFHHKFFGAQLAINTALRNIKDVTVYMDRAIKSGYLSEDIIPRMSLSKSYDELMQIISIIINKFFKLTDAKDKDFYKSNFIILLDELYGNLRRLSEEIHDCDSPLTDSIGQLISDVNSLIIDLLGEKEFKEKQEELKKQLEWNIHLPYWFAHHAKKFRASKAFNTLSDSIAKTGIKLFQKKICDDNDDLIMDCVNALYSLVKQCMEKNNEDYNYYDPPRQMEKIIYLGILARKNNKHPIFTKVKELIREFEELYKKKYLSNLKLPPNIDHEKIIGIPKEDQLFREVLRWRHDFIYQKYNTSKILDTAQEWMLDLIDETDIDWFIFEVWNKVPPYSPIKREIEEKLKGFENKKRADKDK